MKTILLILIVTPILSAQRTDDDHTGHDHHAEHRNEIGVAHTVVYFTGESEFAYGLHVHYVRHLGETRAGIGMGYEHIFDEHKHHTIGVVGSYNLLDRLLVSLSPGITFEGGEETHLNFALHLELSYGFDAGDFHIGPVLEFAYDPEDYHISLGVHIGYGF